MQEAENCISKTKEELVQLNQGIEDVKAEKEMTENQLKSLKIKVHLFTRCFSIFSKHKDYCNILIFGIFFYINQIWKVYIFFEKNVKSVHLCSYYLSNMLALYFKLLLKCFLISVLTVLF